MAVEKYKREGKVAVLYSPGYGAGWSTWIPDIPDVVFDRRIVERVLLGAPVDEEFMVSLGYPEDQYYGGGRDLEIKWVDEGAAFRIAEYDGNESVRPADEGVLIA